MMSGYFLKAQDTKISTVEFIQILNENREEAMYYYNNNWVVLRQIATERQYIDSFSLIETEATEEQSFDIILITTYKNNDQYTVREERFQELIKEKGSLKLLNDKKPGEFRKSLFSTGPAKIVDR